MRPRRSGRSGRNGRSGMERGRRARGRAGRQPMRGASGRARDSTPPSVVMATGETREKPAREFGLVGNRSVSGVVLVGSRSLVGPKNSRIEAVVEYHLSSPPPAASAGTSALGYPQAHARLIDLAVRARARPLFFSLSLLLSLLFSPLSFFHSIFALLPLADPPSLSTLFFLRSSLVSTSSATTASPTSSVHHPPYGVRRAHTLSALCLGGSCHRASTQRRYTTIPRILLRGDTRLIYRVRAISISISIPIRNSTRCQRVRPVFPRHECSPANVAQSDSAKCVETEHPRGYTASFVQQ